MALLKDRATRIGKYGGPAQYFSIYFPYSQKYVQLIVIWSKYQLVQYFSL